MAFKPGDQVIDIHSVACGRRVVGIGIVESVSGTRVTVKPIGRSPHVTYDGEMVWPTYDAADLVPYTNTAMAALKKLAQTIWVENRQSQEQTTKANRMRAKQLAAQAK